MSQPYRTRHAKYMGDYTQIYTPNPASWVIVNILRGACCGRCRPWRDDFRLFPVVT